MSFRSAVLATALLAGLSLASLTPAARAQAQDAAAAPLPGTWQEHQIDLVYMGFTSTYSCDGLQSKLALLLRQLGARSDFKVNAFGCDRGFGSPSKFARATLKFASLQPAEASTPSAPAAAGVAVMGRWRPVELAPHRPFDLADGDCELIEQFRDKVLPLFATRELQNRTTCVPHQDTGGPFSLQMQIFVPAAGTPTAGTPAASK
jgi:hypothetical protein